MSVGIVVFPGSNCDRDMYHVLADVFDLSPVYCWHERGLPDGLDAVILPGGFSYGDRLRAGAIAARSPVIADIKRAAQASVPVLGVCNGFQILVEAGLLPGALVRNDSLGFMCRWTEITVESSRTPFTSGFSEGQRVPIPVANGEGRYYADEETVADMERNNQIVFRYADRLNGSTGRIAGVCSPEGNVVGMMPHPERAAEPEINPGGTGTTSPVFESLRAGVAG